MGDSQILNGKCEFSKRQKFSGREMFTNANKMECVQINRPFGEETPT